MSACRGCGNPTPPSRGGRERIWCSERCRKASYDVYDPCVDCGAPTSSGPRNGHDAQPLCIHCENDQRRAARRLRMEIVRDLRAQGMTNRAIAREIDTSEFAVATLICRARADRIDIAPSPHYLAGRTRTSAWDPVPLLPVPGAGATTAPVAPARPLPIGRAA